MVWPGICPRPGISYFFFLFSLVFSLLQKDESDTMVIINILLLAGSTEIMQLYIDGRFFLLWDVIIDLNGAFYGFILSKLLLSIRRDIWFENTMNNEIYRTEKHLFNIKVFKTVKTKRNISKPLGGG